MDIKIEKNIPLPTKKKKSPKTPPYNKMYPFESMDLGDSFFYENTSIGKKIGARIASAAWRFCQTNKLPWKFKVKREGDGYRTWRIK